MSEPDDERDTLEPEPPDVRAIQVRALELKRDVAVLERELARIVDSLADNVIELAELGHQLHSVGDRNAPR